MWSWGRGQCNHPEPFPVENSWPGELLCECYMLAAARSWGCLLCRRGGSRGLGWRHSTGSGVPRLAQGRGLQGGSSPAAAGPRTGTESQPRADGREGKRVRPLQGAEHASSSPCERREGHSAQRNVCPTCRTRSWLLQDHGQSLEASRWWEMWSTGLRGCVCSEGCSP